jgi:hypothetical protein
MKTHSQFRRTGDEELMQAGAPQTKPTSGPEGRFDACSALDESNAVNRKSAFGGEAHSEAAQGSHARGQYTLTTGFVDWRPRRIGDHDVHAAHTHRNGGRQAGGAAANHQGIAFQAI